MGDGTRAAMISMALGLLLAACGDGPEPAPAPAEARLARAITNGRPALGFDAVVALELGAGRCPGTILRVAPPDAWVLTAAHCLDAGLGPAQLFVGPRAWIDVEAGGAPPPTCDSCVTGAAAAQGACAAALDGCVNDASCSALLGCLDGCGDVACSDACFDAAPTGAVVYRQVIDCICGACALACEAEGFCSGGGGGGGGGGAGGGAAGGAGGRAAGGGGAGHGGDTGSGDAEDGCGCTGGPGTPEGLTLVLAGAALLGRRRPY